MEKKFKLAILESHPVHYRTGIYQKLTESDIIDATVYFCSDSCLKKDKSGFWDVKFFEKSIGTFKYKFLKNYLLFGEERSPRGLWNFGFLYELIKNRPDAILIISYLSLISKITLVYARILGIPILFKEEIDKVNESSEFANKVKDAIFPFMFKLPSMFLYSSTRSKEYYKENRVPDRKLLFHQCAVDNEKFQKHIRNIKSVPKIKKELKLPTNKKIISFVGRFTKRKRVMDVLNAYVAMKSRSKTALLLVGVGPELSELKKAIKKHNLKDVYIIPSIDQKDVYKIYAVSDLFVVVSSYDPSPKVLNEAMNFSIPVIVSDTVGTGPDFVKHGKNGFMIKLGDVKALTTYMDKILTNTKLQKKMGKESLKIVSKTNYNENRKAIEKAVKIVTKKKR